MVLLVVLTCVSILGRSLIFAGLGPIPGDFELVELGVAFAVFAFLPWCQYKGGHARVDLLRRFLGGRITWLTDVLGDLLMAAVAVVIAWRLFDGTVDKFEHAETTFILQLPLGWGYAVCLPGAFAFAFVSVFCLIRTLLLQRVGARKPSRL